MTDALDHAVEHMADLTTAQQQTIVDERWAGRLLEACQDALAAAPHWRQRMQQLLRRIAAEEPPL